MSIALQKANLNFEKLDEIGQEGRNSKVFLAHDKQLDARLVVKQLLKDDIEDPEEFYTEAKILYSTHHPNIVNVHYACEDEESIYIAMPFYKNGSLKQLIDGRHLTVREVIRYSLQFLSGLNYIHSKKLMHFDIKPDNILISDTNDALLSDFGISKALNSNDFVDQEFAYNKQTPPEQFLHDEFSYPYDIYQCGLTIYRMLNGNDSFYHQWAEVYTDEDVFEQAILSGSFPDRELYGLHVPDDLKKIVNKALSVRPEERQSSVLQLINDLGDVRDLLDWEVEFLDQESRYTLDQEDRNYIVTILPNGKKFDIISKRFMKDSARETIINEHCKTNIVSISLRTHLQRIMKKLERD